MGIFLGASILSLSEILEWILDAVMHRITRISKVKPENKIKTARVAWENKY